MRRDGIDNHDFWKKEIELFLLKGLEPAHPFEAASKIGVSSRII
jgi:hypothetical protein